MRLDKFLGTTGNGTRQEVKKMIRMGRVKVNGTIVKTADQKIDEFNDEIVLDGKTISYEEFYYIMFHKPAGCVCSAREKGEISVLSYIKEPYAQKLFPVGRLDKDTEGLLLLTNDGMLSHNLLSPARHVKKTYYSECEKEVTEEDVSAFAEGLDIGDEKLTLPATLQILSKKSCHITITEGRFHQIKRMIEARGNKVCYLKRIRMKDLELDPELNKGEYRPLTATEIEKLKEK